MQKESIPGLAMVQQKSRKIGNYTILVICGRSIGNKIFLIPIFDLHFTTISRDRIEIAKKKDDQERRAAEIDTWIADLLEDLTSHGNINNLIA